MKNWYKENRPAIFIVTIFFIGIILILGSSAIPSHKEYQEILKSIMVGIGATLLTGGIATLFLNFPETKKYLSQSMTNLFLSGEVINSLTNEHRAILNKEIISHDTNIPTTKLELDLLTKLTFMQRQCLTDYHLSNYVADFTINDSKKYTNLVEEEQFISYRVSTRHLPDSHNRLFKIVSEYETPFYNNATLTIDEFIQHFDVKAGDLHFNEKDLEVSEVIIGKVKYFKYRFSTEVMIKDVLDIEIKVRLIKPLLDTSFSLYVRYPTKGFTAKLSYTDEYQYMCNWFRYWDKEENILDLITDGKVFTNGISAISREWILPGEGIVLEFNK